MVKGHKNNNSKLNILISQFAKAKNKEQRVKVGFLENETHNSSKNEAIKIRELARFLNKGDEKTPARPFNAVALERAITVHIPLFLKNLNVFNYDIEISKLLETLTSDYKQVIIGAFYTFTPNSPKTVAIKGFNHPLVDSGLMIRMVQGQINQNKMIGKGREV